MVMRNPHFGEAYERAGERQSSEWTFACQSVAESVASFYAFVALPLGEVLQKGETIKAAPRVSAVATIAALACNCLQREAVEQ
jgi:hypothetical protein